MTLDEAENEFYDTIIGAILVEVDEYGTNMPNADQVRLAYRIADRVLQWFTIEKTADPLVVGFRWIDDDGAAKAFVAAPARST